MRKIVVRGILILILILSGETGLGVVGDKCYHSEQLDKLILQGDYSKALELGEKMMACYRDEKPDIGLYFRLAVIYLNLGDSLKASDILDILSSEYKLNSYEQWAYKQISEVLSTFIVVQLGAFSEISNAVKFANEVESEIKVKCFVEKKDGLYKVRARLPLLSIDKFQKDLMKKWGVRCKRIS